MERALNGTKMGGSKLIANLARFAKENEGINGGPHVGSGGLHAGTEDNDKDTSNHPKVPKFQNQSLYMQGRGKLFSELFHNNFVNPVPENGSGKEVGISIDIADGTLAFPKLIGRAMVGRCKDLKVLKNLDSLLVDSKQVGVSLSYLGGLSMLLKFEEEAACVKFLLDNQRWKVWFNSLEPWEGQPLPFERLAWVKVQGVPLQLADNDVNNIAEHFGKIVHGAQMEAEDENFSASWIGLLVGEGGRIQEQVTLKWKNKQFRVWLIEDVSVWTPDSVDRVVVPGDSSSSPGNIELNNQQIKDNSDVNNDEVPSRPEIEKVVERSKEVSADADFGFFNNENCHNGVKEANVSHPHVVKEPQFFSEGTNVNRKWTNPKAPQFTFLILQIKN
ncbi:hypothetical protein Hdeb2414_s0018g00521811 [Helianthus debilis subsp. tardiflorus]